MHKILLSICLLICGNVHYQLFAQDLEFKTFLSPTVIESSGLLYLDGKLITHTDSGGEAALYEIDRLTGDVLRTVYLDNSTNVDWEDICVDQDYLYIGDFGNNAGNRTDLKVYRLSITDYLNTSNDTVQVDTINFSYLEQVDFTAGSNNTNFDAEAMISYGNMLYIFSKNWLTNTCDVYALSKNPGNYSLSKIDSFDSQGLVTGAAYNPSNNSVLLCGYGPPIPFVLFLSDFSNGLFSNGLSLRSTVQVASGASVQIEAVTHKEEDIYFLSSETSVLGAASLFSFDRKSVVLIQDQFQEKRMLYPNPTEETLRVALKGNEHLELYSLNGQFIMRSKESILNLSKLASGTYLLLIKNNRDELIDQQRFVLK